MRRTRTLWTGVLGALALAAVAAPPAAAFEAPFRGKLKLQLKELFEDDSVDKTKDTFKDSVTDFSLGTSANIQFGSGPLTMTWSVQGLSAYKAKIVPSDPPETDQDMVETWLNSLGGDRCTADVTAVNIKKGLHKVNKKFKRSRFKLKFSGSYLCTDGPRMGENVDFGATIVLKNGKRIPIAF